jgi:hypothetical protein
MRSQSVLVAAGFLAALAGADRAGAAISISVQNPYGQSVAGDLSVHVTVTSTFDIEAVTARIDATDFPLAYGCSPYCGWHATIDLEALAIPPGDTLLRVTAEDVFASTAEVSRNFVYAPPPVITVHEPSAWAVALPRIRVRASCEDVVAAPCASFTLTRSRLGLPDQTLISTTTAMDAEVDLSTTDENQPVSLTFRAVGVSGTPAFAVRSIHVETNANLVEVDRVPGLITTADETRVLYVDDDSGTVRIHDRVSDLDTSIFALRDPDADSPIIGESALTPYGALFSIQPFGVPGPPQCNGLYACIFEWRDDGIHELGAINSADSLVREGNWAIWSDGSTLRLRDLAAATNQVVTTGAANGGAAVASNGDVVYPTPGTSNRIERWRAGNTEVIGDGGGALYSRPGTDGAGVVYRRLTNSSPAGYLYEIAFHSASGTETLSGPSLGEPAFQIRDGWVAFTRRSNGGQLQIWRRDPMGSIARKTFFASSSRIQSLGPAGQLSFINANQHYLVPSEAPANFVGIGIGPHHGGRLESVVLADGLHVHLGGSLFRVTALEDPDADGVANYTDNCRNELNPEQMDANQDGVGEPCGCAWVGAGVLTCDTFLHGTAAIADESHDEASVWIRSAGCDARGDCAAPGAPAHGTLATGGLVGGWLAVQDASDLVLNGGSVEGSVAALESATATIFDGAIAGGLVARDEASIRWEGGAVGGALVAYDDSLIEVIGDEFEVNGVSVALGDLGAQTGMLSGRLASGELFSVSFFQGGPAGTATTGTIRLVPEPHAALLAAVASLALAARQRKRRPRR